MSNRARRYELDREAVRQTIQERDQGLRAAFPLAYEVWQAIQDKPQAYGMEMVIDVLAEAERIQKNNEDR